MALLNKVFVLELDTFVNPYLGDILDFSKTLEYHYGFQKIVLERLGESNLYGRISKCELAVNKVQKLGRIIF